MATLLFKIIWFQSGIMILCRVTSGAILEGTVRTVFCYLDKAMAKTGLPAKLLMATEAIISGHPGVSLLLILIMTDVAITSRLRR